tara:strand:+ start:24869 stop:25645 length:777 start_codon:yes stop_codon:yes gene_type:complete
MKKFISNIFLIFSFKKSFILKILFLPLFITSIFYISWFFTLENSNNKKYINLNLSFNNTCEIGHILESYITKFYKKRYIVHLQRSLNNEFVELSDLIKLNLNYCSESMSYELIMLEDYKDQLLNYINKIVYSANNLNSYKKNDYNNLFEKLHYYLFNIDKLDNNLMNQMIFKLIKNQDVNIKFNKTKNYSKGEYIIILNRINIFNYMNSFREITFIKTENVYNQKDYFKINKIAFFLIVYSLFFLFSVSLFKFFEESK